MSVIHLGSKPIIIAHRGKQTDRNPALMAPENTARAFKLVNDLNKTRSAQSKIYTEFDVQLTKDRHPAIHHDDETGRVFQLPGGPKRIDRVTWATLRQATLNTKDYMRKVSSITGKPYQIPKSILAEHVTDLEETLDITPDTPLMLEMKIPSRTFSDLMKQFGGVFKKFSSCVMTEKRPHEASHDIARIVYETVKKKNALNRVTFLSFDPDCLREIKELDPTVKTVLDLSIPKPFNWLERNTPFLKLFIPFVKNRYKLDGINPCYQNTSEDFVKVCHQHKLEIMPYVYPETREQEAKAFPEFERIGVAGVITNAVDLAQDYFEKRRT